MRALRDLPASVIPPAGPRRTLASATFVNTVGFGLIFSTMTLYFTRVLHLTNTQVGVGLTIAGLVGLLSGVPIGHLADIRGPRDVSRAVLAVQVLVTLSWTQISGFAAFVVVASIEVMCFEAYGAASGALLRRVGGDDAAFRSHVRAIGNVGLALGSVGAGVAVAIDTPAAYRTIITVNAVTFLVAAILLGRLPHYPPLPKSAEDEAKSWRIALADPPFIVYALLAGALSMQYWVVTDPLPLWIAGHTQAPLWTVSVLFVVNTVMVSLIQVRVGRNVETLRQGGAALRNSGLVFLVSCTAIGLAAGLPSWVAFLWLVVAIAIHTYGEVWFSSGQFALDFGLPPAHAQGQYQGLAGVGTSLGTSAAPVLMIGLVLSLGEPGWIGLGVMFGLLGLLGPVVARWGERTRVRVAAQEGVPGDEPAAL